MGSFSWKKIETASAVVEKIRNERSPSSSNSSTNGSNPIALIAHGYGDDEEEDSGNDENELQEVDHNILTVKEYSQEKKSATTSDETTHIKHDMKTSLSGSKNRKRKIELKVKSSKLAKDSNSQSLQPSAAIFQESQDDTDDETIPNEQCDEPEKETNAPDNSDLDSIGDFSDPSKSKDVKHNSKTKQFDTITGNKIKKYLHNVAETFCAKLEALQVQRIIVPTEKVIAIQLETMFEAWHNSALSAGYMQKFLSKMQREMAQLEAQELAPPGWRVIWNRYSG